MTATLTTPSTTATLGMSAQTGDDGEPVARWSPPMAVAPCVASARLPREPLPQLLAHQQQRLAHVHVVQVERVLLWW